MTRNENSSENSDCIPVRLETISKALDALNDYGESFGRTDETKEAIGNIVEAAEEAGMIDQINAISEHRMSRLNEKEDTLMDIMGVVKVSMSRSITIDEQILDFGGLPDMQVLGPIKIDSQTVVEYHDTDYPGKVTVFYLVRGRIDHDAAEAMLYDLPASVRRKRLFSIRLSGPYIDQLGPSKEKIQFE